MHTDLVRFTPHDDGGRLCTFCRSSPCHSIIRPPQLAPSFAEYEEVATLGDGRDPVQFVDVCDVAIGVVESIERKLTGIHNMAAFSLLFRKFFDSCKLAVDSCARQIWIAGMQFRLKA